MRRDDAGQFTDDQVSAGRSVAQDKRIDAKHEAKTGDKDRGDERSAHRREEARHNGGPLSFPSDDLAAGHELVDEHDERDHEKDVHERAEGRQRQEADEPEDH